MRWFWLDRFTEFVSGSHATALKCVSLSEDHLHDHWPYYPLMPNSLVAEGMAQCGGLLVSEVYKFSELVVLAKFARCTFDGEVRPGDTRRRRFFSPGSIPMPRSKPRGGSCSTQRTCCTGCDWSEFLTSAYVLTARDCVRKTIIFTRSTRIDSRCDDV